MLADAQYSLCNGCDRQGICEQRHGLHIFAVPAVGSDAAERGRYEDYLRGEGQEVKRKGLRERKIVVSLQAEREGEASARYLIIGVRSFFLSFFIHRRIDEQSEYLWFCFDFHGTEFLVVRALQRY